MVSLSTHIGTIEGISEVECTRLIGDVLLEDDGETLLQYGLCLLLIATLEITIRQRREDLIAQGRYDATGILIEVRTRAISTAPAELCHHRLVHTIQIADAVVDSTARAVDTWSEREELRSHTRLHHASGHSIEGIAGRGDRPVDRTLPLVARDEVEDTEGTDIEELTAVQAQ